MEDTSLGQRHRKTEKKDKAEAERQCRQCEMDCNDQHHELSAVRTHVVYIEAGTGKRRKHHCVCHFARVYFDRHLFDIIGVASTVATEKRFHSMAARRVNGAKQAIWIVRNAEKVGSFCNDVVGDISGIISGATSAVIITRLTQDGTDVRSVILSLIITGCVSSLTIGGKAIGKTFAISHSEDIVFLTGRVLSILPWKK